MLKQLMISQRAAIWYLLLVVCLPLLTLVILGLVMLWQNNLLMMVSAIWLLVTTSGYVIYRFWPESRATHPSASNSNPTDGVQNQTINATPPPDDLESDRTLSANLPLRLEARDDWTAIDKRVWLRSVEAVEDALLQQPEWKALPELCLQMLTVISEYYNIENQLLIEDNAGKSTGKPGKIYSFTLPEVLLVLSITSSRYRQLILDYIPFSEKIKVSALLNLYAKQDQIMTGAKWANNIRRTTRFVNPLAAVTAELRDQFTNRIFTNLSEKVQNDLKRLLLQELVQVGMDLYSGRLKSTIAELSDYSSSSFSQDSNSQYVPVEPIRVVLAGQVSSGKSSLINALINRLQAETDILPTTDITTVHSLHWPADDTNHADNPVKPEPIHLIDTIGLDNSADNLLSLVDIAQQADLLIWVVRANQPAKAPDAALYQSLQKAFNSQPMRRPAPVLLVLTHIDQLKPKAIWQPPYDLDSNDAKATNIKKAMDSCRQQIGLPDNLPVVPVCLAQNSGLYNVDLVAAQIMLLYSDASQTQLNRRRIEKDSAGSSWRDRWNQASKLGTVTGKVLVRSVLGD